MERLEYCKENFKECARKKPDEVLDLAMHLAVEDGNWDSLDAVSEILMTNPGRVGKRARRQACRSGLHRQDWKEAAKYCALASRDAPHDPLPRISTAWALFSLDQPGAAAAIPPFSELPADLVCTAAAIWGTTRYLTPDQGLTSQCHEIESPTP